MRHCRLFAAVTLALLALVRPAAAAPEGQMTWGIHISLAPTWFDPARVELPGQQQLGGPRRGTHRGRARLARFRRGVRAAAPSGDAGRAPAAPEARRRAPAAPPARVPQRLTVS